MATNNQFSIAIHLLANLGFCPDDATTSAKLAMSVNANPSFLRRILSQLAKAGLVHTTTGKNGACVLAKKAKQISLLEIYNALELPKAFAIHNYPKQKQCPVSCNIKTTLEGVLDKAQAAMESPLKDITLADVIAQIKKQ